MSVALSPDQFGSVKSGHNVEEELSSAFDRLEHEVSDGPDVSIGHAAGEVAIVDGKSSHEDENAPERNFAHDIGDAQAGKRGELCESGSGSEDLVDGGKPGGDQTTRRPRFCEFLLSHTSRLFAADAGGEGFDRHGE